MKNVKRIRKVEVKTVIDNATNGTYNTLTVLCAGVEAKDVRITEESAPILLELLSIARSYGI